MSQEVIQRWFNSLPSSANFDILRSFSAEKSTILFELSDHEGPTFFTLTVCQEQITSSQSSRQVSIQSAGKTNIEKDPALTIICNQEDFTRLILSQVSGKELLLSGKLRVYGDMALLLRLRELFKEYN